MTTKRLIPWIPAAAVLSFLVLEAIAMASYPGGTWFDRTTVGFSFSQNFFCDLTSPLALDGAPNPAAPFARAAMLVLAIGLAPFFWSLAALVDKGQRVVRIAGTLGAIGAASIPFLPTLVVGDLHGIVSVIAGVFGLVAAAMAIRGAFACGARLIATVGAATFVAGATVASLYVFAQLTHARVETLPLTQKVAAGLLLGWMLAPLAVRPHDGPRGRRDGSPPLTEAA